MSNFDYLLKGFGYKSLNDFITTSFGMFFLKKAKFWLSFTVAYGTVQAAVSNYLGLKWVVFVALIWLVAAEMWTGLKVAKKVRGEKIKSRKLGRMMLKLGVYVQILFVLNSFTKQADVPAIFDDIPLNPYVWLYNIFLAFVLFQLFISWMENLGRLGYKEAKSFAGFFLRKFNKWFEFDGSKDNGEE